VIVADGKPLGLTVRTAVTVDVSRRAVIVAV